MSICSICMMIDCENRHSEMSPLTSALCGTKYDNKKVTCVEGCGNPDNDRTFCYGCDWFNVDSRVCGKLGEARTWVKKES